MLEPGADTMWVDTDPVWTSHVCAEANVSYAHRVDDVDNYNFCVVPKSGSDAVLYGAFAVLFGCLVSGKLSSVWILITGAVVETLAFHYNMRQFSNASSLWLGMQPPDLFFYTFLPPLLLDAAIRIEFFTFRKVASQVITFAVGAVLGMVAVMTPLLLYGFDLGSSGWHWSHAALFVCMIASTDAVAVSAVLKKANGPETLGVLMEGESLFNDATSIVMFEVFREKVRDYEDGTIDEGHFLLQIANMLKSMAVLAIGGALMGLIAGWITTKLMKILRVRGMGPPFEVSVSVGVCYLVFYITNGPLQLSGVIAVVVFGIYGSATLKWDMSAGAAQEEFPNFWDVLSQITNTITFFFAGAVCANFFIRSTRALEEEGFGRALAVTFWRLPIVFVGMLTVRAMLIALFSPMLSLFGASLDWRGIVFVTVGGLRGALCLIMVQTVMLDMGLAQRQAVAQVKNALAIWTAGIVVLTLVINAPALSFVLRITGLTHVSLLTLQTRDKARRAFLRFSNDKVHELQKDQDDLLQGVDWVRVRQIIDCSKELQSLVSPNGDCDIFLESDPQEEAVDDDLRMNTTDFSAPGRVVSVMAAGSKSDRVPGVFDLTQAAQMRMGSYYVSHVNMFDAPGDPQRRSGGAASVDGAPGESATPRSPNPAGLEERGSADAASASRATPARAMTPPPAPRSAVPSTPTGATRTAAGLPSSTASADGDRAGGAIDSRAASQSSVFVSPHVEDDGERGTTSSSFEPPKHTVHSMAHSAPPKPPSERSERGEHALRTGLSSTQVTQLNDQQRADRLKALEKESKKAAAQDQVAENFSLDRQARHTNRSALTHSRSASIAHADDISRPLMDCPSDVAEEGPLPGLRTEPYVVVADPKYGFMAPDPFNKFMRKTVSGMDGADKAMHNSRSTGLHSEWQGVDSVSATATSAPRAAKKAAPSRGEKDSRMTNMGHQIELHQLSALPTSATARLRSEMLAEMRMRTVAGMKRYFHKKRHEGLLSSHGMRMLDNACDLDMDDPTEDIDIFGYLHKDFSTGPVVWALSRLHFSFRSYLIRCKPIRPKWLRSALTAPLYLCNRALADFLSGRMLLALEAAIEYWLAIKHALQARFLDELHVAGPGGTDADLRQKLKEELLAQKGEVWMFILDRHVEAPDRFRAIQTYRAAMAVMAQQRNFIVKMYNTGLLNDTERELMDGAVEAKERALREKGAAWDPPSISTSLREVPFFTNLCEDFFEEIILQGHLVKYSQGSEIVETEIVESNPDEARIGIILSGLATTTVAPVAALTPALAEAPESSAAPATMYLTHGSVFGLMSTMTGVEMPGRGNVLAHSGQRGTHVFEIPKTVVANVLERAADGDSNAQALARGLYTLTSTQVVDRFSELIFATVEEALAQMARPASASGTPSGPLPPAGAKSKWRKYAKAALGEVHDTRAIWSAMRSALQTADVISLQPTAPAEISASAVLLHGSLLRVMPGGATERAPATATSASGHVGSVKAPCVLVWPSFAKEQQATMSVRAGSDGATLVLCGGSEEARLRRQFTATEKVLKNLKIVKGGDSSSVKANDTLEMPPSIFETHNAGANAVGVSTAQVPPPIHETNT